MPLKEYKSLEQMLSDLNQIVSGSAAADSMNDLCGTYWSIEASHLMRTTDPFTDEYHGLCMELYALISGRSSYDPLVNEQAPHISNQSVVRPTPYHYADSLTLGDFFMGWGWIMRNLNVKAGHTVLEYGAGEGQLAITLSRMGCEVSVIDIEQRCLDFIKAQCDSLGIAIGLKRGEFGEKFEDRRFDRIVFFEAFHHAVQHRDVVRCLMPQLNDEGFVLFSGEPIIKRGAAEEVFVPFPWGPRLDGLSVWSSRLHGWCELGFQEGYFVDFLMREGWLVKASPCPVTARGNCYIVRPAGCTIDVGADYLLGTYRDDDGGWHAPEGSHRWTKGHAFCPIPNTITGAVASIEMVNFFPFKRSVTVLCGNETSSFSLMPGKECCAKVRVPQGAHYIEIISETAKPTDVWPGNSDQRSLGVPVQQIRFND
jgi:hypothetical protein